MNNKYIDLNDYSIKLNDSIKKIDSFSLSIIPKQIGSLKVTFKNIQNNINNLKELQKLENVINSLPSLDEETKKGNVAAQKAEKKIREIKNSLNGNFQHLKKEFFRLMAIAGKQLEKVSSVIKDEEERKKFDREKQDFKNLVSEAKYYKEEIPFDVKGFDEPNIKAALEEQAKKADEEPLFDPQNPYILEERLSALENVLKNIRQTHLVNEVKREVAVIKKALPPKTIAIAKNGLETLRNSSKLLDDLEQIQEVLGTTHEFMGKNGKMQKLNRQLEELTELLKKAIQYQSSSNTEMRLKQNIIDKQIDYAKDATRYYQEILQSNDKKTEEKTKMDERASSVSEEIGELEKQIQKLENDVKMVFYNSQYSQEEAQTIAHKLQIQIAQKRREINFKQQFISFVKENRPDTLDETYSNSKRELEECSALYNYYKYLDKYYNGLEKDAMGSIFSHGRNF